MNKNPNLATGSRKQDLHRLVWLRLINTCSPGQAYPINIQHYSLNILSVIKRAEDYFYIPRRFYSILMDKISALKPVV